MPFMKLMGEFKMILLIDNYDSFAYNLYQLIGSITDDIKVIRNDEMTVEQITALNPAAIVISPGPGRPKDAGVIEDVIRYFYDKKPLLGICLGHQALGQVLGGKVEHAPVIVHGKSSMIEHKGQQCFKDLPNPLKVARYHSLVVTNLPSDVEVLSTFDNMCMSLYSKKYNVLGFQFHPESIMSTYGRKLLKNAIEEL